MVNSANVYLREVALLMERLLVKPEGAIIMDTPKHKIGLGMSSVVVFVKEGKKILKWDEVDEEMLYDIYCFLDTTQKLFPKVAESIIELGSADEKTWHIEPVDIIDPTGEISLGKLGVAIESKTDDGEQLAVVFISPDGTWATLTMYRKDFFGGEVITAKNDLLCLGVALTNFVKKL